MLIRHENERYPYQTTFALILITILCGAFAFMLMHDLWQAPAQEAPQALPQLAVKHKAYKKSMKEQFAITNSALACLQQEIADLKLHNEKFLSSMNTFEDQLDSVKNMSALVQAQSLAHKKYSSLIGFLMHKVSAIHSRLQEMPSAAELREMCEQTKRNSRSIALLQPLEANRCAKVIWKK